jgi:hypothetical protein
MICLVLHCQEIMLLQFEHLVSDMITYFSSISSGCFLTGLSAISSGKPPIITLQQVTH